MVIKNEADLLKYITQKKVDGRWGWEKIANALATQEGYVSPRTEKPLSPFSIRQKFYYHNNPTRERALTVQHELHAKNGSTYPVDGEGHARTLDLVRIALKMKTDDKSKLAFIEQLLKET